MSKRSKNISNGKSFKTVYATHCTTDPEHMANLNKMHSGGRLTPSDFKLYQTLSHSDLNNLNNFFHGTIIVTGNCECQELNAFVAKLWIHLSTLMLLDEKKE